MAKHKERVVLRSYDTRIWDPDFLEEALNRAEQRFQDLWEKYEIKWDFVVDHDDTDTDEIDNPRKPKKTKQPFPRTGFGLRSRRGAVFRGTSHMLWSNTQIQK